MIGGQGISNLPRVSEVIGLVPAAGLASRLSPLPCSKELYPIALHPKGPDGSPRPKVAAEYLLERMRQGGIGRVILILRSGKWDVPAYFGEGSIVGLSLAYVIAGLPFGPPFSLDSAHAFVGDAVIAFGFPDILFQPDHAFAALLARRAESGADVILGLFPAGNPRTLDTVELNSVGRVVRMDLKPSTLALPWTWMLAVWGPSFTRFMHQHLADVRDAVAAAAREVHMGEVIRAALHAGLVVEGVTFPDGHYLDIGEPEGLASALREPW